MPTPLTLCYSILSLCDHGHFLRGFNQAPIKKKTLTLGPELVKCLQKVTPHYLFMLVAMAKTLLSLYASWPVIASQIWSQVLSLLTKFNDIRKHTCLELKLSNFLLVWHVDQMFHHFLFWVKNNYVLLKMSSIRMCHCTMYWRCKIIVTFN